MIIRISTDPDYVSYIVMMGATISRLATRIPSSEMRAVNRRARNGSPLLVVTPNTFRKGMTPSLAMACNKRGAPIKINRF